MAGEGSPFANAMQNMEGEDPLADLEASQDTGAGPDTSGAPAPAPEPRPSPAPGPAPAPEAEMVPRTELDRERERADRLEHYLMTGVQREERRPAEPAQPALPPEKARAEFRDQSVRPWVQALQKQVLEANPLTPERHKELLDQLYEKPADFLHSSRLRNIEDAAAILTEYHADLVPAVRKLIAETISAALGDRERRVAEDGLVDTTFARMYNETHPHLGEHWRSLIPDFQESFRQRAMQIADQVAQQMTGNAGFNRNNLVVYLSQRGQQDLLERYLQHVGNEITRQLQVPLPASGNGTPAPAPAAAAPRSSARGARGAAPTSRPGAGAPTLEPAVGGIDNDPMGGILDSDSRGF